MTDAAEEFQKKTENLVVRNANILDIITKCQGSCDKICRSTVKSATGCGCIEISAEKEIPALTRPLLSPRQRSGIDGTLCPECKSRVENEIGETLFYIASLCNALELSLSEIMQQEIKRVEILGRYSLR